MLSLMNAGVQSLVGTLKSHKLRGMVKKEKKKKELMRRKLNRWGFPGGASAKEPTCQCRRLSRLGFDPWVGKIPWRKAWQPAWVFLPGESHGRGTWGTAASRGSQSQAALKPLSTARTQEAAGALFFLPGGLNGISCLFTLASVTLKSPV